MLPLLGDAWAMGRLLRDRRAAPWAKAVVLAALVYVLWPLDAVPDSVPVISWLDDMGALVVGRLVLGRLLEPYRRTSDRPAETAEQVSKIR